MAKDDFFDKLPHKTKLKLLKAKDFIPTLARGHGSLRKGKCRVENCSLDQNHFNNRVKIAYDSTE